jgi:hypothetical protein
VERMNGIHDRIVGHMTLEERKRQKVRLSTVKKNLSVRKGKGK